MKIKKDSIVEGLIGTTKVQAKVLFVYDYGKFNAVILKGLPYNYAVQINNQDPRKWKLIK